MSKSLTILSAFHADLRLVVGDNVGDWFKRGVAKRMRVGLTIFLLTISNVFMTFAWYGHLKFKAAPLWQAIFISWLIASLEYCFQVPANRVGSYDLTAAQLKIIQEVITLTVFGFFSVLYLKQQFQWNYAVAFGLMIAAVFFVFNGNSNGNGAQVESNQPEKEPHVVADLHTYTASVK